MGPFVIVFKGLVQAGIKFSIDHAAHELHTCDLPRPDALRPPCSEKSACAVWLWEALWVRAPRYLVNEY